MGTQGNFGSCAQSQAKILTGFGTGRLREESRGLLVSFLTFLINFVSLQIQNISNFCLIFSECGNCKHPYFIGEVRIFSSRYS